MNTFTFFNDAIELLSEVLIIAKSDGKIIYISPNCQYILDLSEDSILHTGNIENLFKKMGAKPVEKIDSLVPATLELQCKGTNNSVRHLEVRISPDHLQNNTFYYVKDISSYKKSEKQLEKINEELENRIEEQTVELQRKDIALAELMNQLDVERNNLSKKIDINTQKLLLPILDRLIEKSSKLDSRYLTMLKQNLRTLTSSFGMRLTSIEYGLTPKEIELCTLIKGGFTIKEIATMQNLSERTVETHRFNIRKKLGISSKKTNLATFLMDL